MPLKFKKGPMRSKPRAGGRRLGGPGSGRRKGARRQYKALQPVRNIGRLSSNIYTSAKEYLTGRRTVTPRLAQKNFNNRLLGDNIASAPTFKIGKPKKLSFDEKVDRITNPPQTLKRNYAWSAESASGRKSFFGIPLNKLSQSTLYGDLYDDAIANATRLVTESAGSDPTLSFNQASGQRAYIDYQSDCLKMVNSSSNSLTGKVYLFKYKRDTEATFTNVNAPMTPINLMMFGSTNNLAGNGANYEATVGNGWAFGTTGSTGTNYTANYDMPGSAINTLGVCAHTDPELQVLSKHISHFTGYYFDMVKSFDFALKPGQQIKHWTIFNDMPNIVRQNTDMAYVKDVSYYLVVEFQGGIVGDTTVTTGDNIISTGTAQLSCILEEKRILGLRGRSKGGRQYLMTPPLTQIALASQYTINPDTGVADTGGADIDS